MPSRPGWSASARARFLAADRIDRTCWQSRLVQRVDQQHAGQARLRRRLVDDRVPAEQGAGHHAHRQGGREIERRDHAEHADRPQLQRRRLVRKGAAHVAREAAVGLHLVAVIGDQVVRLLGLAHRLDARLADFEQAGDAEIVFAPRQDFGGAAQHPHPLRPRRARPGRERRPRRRDRPVDGAGRRLDEPADRDTVVDRAGFLVAPALLVRPAGDAVGMEPAEPLPELGDGAVEHVVQRREIDADVRIGDARQIVGGHEVALVGKAGRVHRPRQAAPVRRAARVYPR